MYCDCASYLIFTVLHLILFDQVKKAIHCYRFLPHPILDFHLILFGSAGLTCASVKFKRPHPLKSRNRLNRTGLELNWPDHFVEILKRNAML